MQEELREAEEMQHQENQASQNTRIPPTQGPENEVSVTVKKPTPDTPIGISMKTSKGVTRIVGILENGLLKNTKLRGGLEIVQINGVGVKNAKHARILIQAANDTVTIEARDLSVEV